MLRSHGWARCAHCGTLPGCKSLPGCRPTGATPKVTSRCRLEDSRNVDVDRRYVPYESFSGGGSAGEGHPYGCGATVSAREGAEGVNPR